MKRCAAFLLAFHALLLAGPALAQQASVASPPDAAAERDRLLATQGRAMGVLGLWSATSVVTGAGLWAFGRTPFVRAIGVQQLAWGAIDGAIAALSYRGVLSDREKSEPVEHWQRERSKLKTILAVNVALDVLYVAAGGALLGLGKREAVRGAGAGVLPQGAFLLVFDSAFLMAL